jgi:zinc-ribbon domain
MAAFCGCCGAEITDHAEACPVCGTPRHGMIPAGLPASLAEEYCSLCGTDLLPPCQGATPAGEDEQTSNAVPANKLS